MKPDGRKLSTKMNKIELANALEALNEKSLVARQLSQFIGECGDVIDTMVEASVGLSVYDSSDYEELAADEFEVVIDYGEVAKDERDEFGVRFDLAVPAGFEIKSRNDEECQLTFILKSIEK